MILLLAILLTYLPPSQDVRREHLDIGVNLYTCYNKTTRLLSQPGLTTSSEKENTMAEEILAGEEWKSITGWEGIAEVSSCGRIRTLERRMHTMRCNKIIPTRVLSPTINTDGYRKVTLSYGPKRQILSVARLVVSTFIGTIPFGMEVNHKDGVKTNNHISNLEIVTKQQNCRHRDDNGLRIAPKGENCGQAKLTNIEASEIVKSLESGSRQIDLARRYGVSISTVHLIAKGKTWTHIPRGVAECSAS